MKAINLTNKNPGGKREKLIDKLPLSTPYVVQLFPIYSCNFKCSYCGVFNRKKKDRFFITDKEIMDFSLFHKCIIDMKYFPEKIKTLRFVGVGEPLLHKQIVQMLQYSYFADVSNNIELITNGSLLTKEMSDKLLEVDCIDRIVISVQGLNSKSYREISGVKLDFDKFVDNIKYFYEHKNKTHVYIKIANIALNNKKDEERFYDIFGNICDSIGIEHVVDIHTGTNIEYKNKDISQFGEKVKDINICPLPFYFMEIRPDGNCIPCYNFEPPISFYNAKKESMVDIWNNNAFRQMMILARRKNIPICNTCTMSQYRYHKEDDLDNSIKKLKTIY